VIPSSASPDDRADAVDSSELVFRDSADNTPRLSRGNFETLFT
jgi:hypothetical protein